MFDFALTETGDFAFLKNEKKQAPLRVSFAVTNGNAFKLSFRTEDIPRQTKPEQALSISFHIGKRENDKQILLLSDADAKIQAIKIRIQTALGNIAGRPTLGSKLETMRHKTLYDVSVQNKVMAMAKEAIADILPDASVKVQPEAVRTSRGYTQRMSLFIYNNNVLIFKYSIGGS